MLRHLMGSSFSLSYRRIRKFLAPEASGDRVPSLTLRSLRGEPGVEKLEITPQVMKSVLDEYPLVIAPASPFEAEASALLEQLWTELAQKYPDELEGTPFQPEQVAGPGAIFLLATIADRSVGCGAFRLLEPGVAEVKRMFVLPAARRFGVGRKILEQLESAAEAMGYSTLRLETGLRQPEAIRLYDSAGYRRVLGYGPYSNNPLSVCFEKSLRK